jgi:hypothetical protein
MYYAIAAGLVLLIGLAIWKFFNPYLKYFIIAVVLAIPIVYMFMPTAEIKDPVIGKLAYGVQTKSFLGKIVVNDKRAGEYVVEISGLKKRYPMENVIVSDKIMPKDPTPATAESTAAPSPAATK